MSEIDINQPVSLGQDRDNSQNPTMANSSQGRLDSDTNRVSENYYSGEVPSHYFISVDPVIRLLIIAGLCLLTMGWLAPDYIPSFLGKIAELNTHNTRTVTQTLNTQ